MPGKQPVMLTPGIVSIAGNGRTRLANEEDLRCPFDNGMWLDRISLSNSSAAPISALGCRVMFQLDDIQLMNDYASFLCLTRRLDANVEPLLTWKFPKPMYIPQGKILAPTFLNTGTSAENVRLTYHGWRADMVPKTTPVPWVGVYVGAASTLSAQTADQSQPMHLVNPFDRPMQVERFATRALRVVAATGDTVIDPATGSADVGAAVLSCLVRMVKQDGSILVRDPTPLEHLGDFLDDSWAVNTLLSPKEFAIAYVDYLAQTVAINSFRPHIYMVGSREVNL